MRVLLLTNHLNRGGISSYCLLLGRYLKSGGHEVVIASGGGQLESRASEWGIEHFRVPMNTSSEVNPKLMSAYLRLKRLVQARQIDIVHDQTRVAQVLSFFLGRKARFKRVSTCHGFFKRRFFRSIFPLWGERVIAVSEAVGEHLERDWDLDGERIRIIPHGVAAFSREEKEEEVRRRTRRPLGISPQALLVGALGRLSPVKGFDILLRAAALLRDENPRIEVLIVGEGPESRRLRRMAKREPLKGRVQVVSALEKDSDFFDAIDIFCAPSREEGFGLSILEAMYAGVPVVASRVGGIPSLIQDGQTGVLVPQGEIEPLAEALRLLALDEEYRNSLAEAGLSYATRAFPIEKMIEKTQRVYEELVVS